jgi:hypothetical protein
MAFNADHAKKVLNQHRDELAAELTGGSADQYLQEFDALLAKLNTPVVAEDRRLAAQMAVDMAKTFIQIALAGIAALVVYSQVEGYPAFYSVTFWFWTLTFLCLLGSMVLGATAVSRISKRVREGNASVAADLWDTNIANKPINFQAYSGLAAVVFFGLLVVLREPQKVKGVEVDLPGGDRYITLTSGELIIGGRWQELYILNPRTQEKSQLPPTNPGQSDSIRISPN